ncbi:MAG: signal peptidase II [Anaerolineae bacterium]|nr:signal peptidase II [Gemmatimonadaceae bacterium]
MRTEVEFALLILAAVGVLIVLDQVTKAWVERSSGRGAPKPAAKRSWLEVRVVRHSFKPTWINSAAALLLLWTSVVAGIAALVHDGRLFQHPIAQMALGVAIGGATTNLIDRLRSGSVINFVRVGWWPVFNLGDVAIPLGVLGALAWMR